LCDPIQATKVHSVEAFGPVSTVMGYSDLDTLTLTNRGGGSLVASVYTHDPRSRPISCSASAVFMDGLC
jgi:oxepin-CoA hydrolase/3-oxo-5,6-dehydrosuberyl-CoA semialdehyde dehydrogenase